MEKRYSRPGLRVKFILKRSVLVLILGMLSSCFPTGLEYGSDAGEMEGETSEEAWGKTILEQIPTGIPGVQEFSSDYQAVRLAWFYKPPSSGNLDILADRYDFFVLTRMDEQERDQLIQSGVETPVIQYLLFPVIMDPGSCAAQPYHNQVAMEIGDFCEIETNHPEWFLRGLAGGLLSNSDGYVMMDPGSEGWREFWIDRARRSQDEYGWHGVFLDNVEAGLGKRYERGEIPQRYLTDASYQAAVEDNLRYLYETYFFPSGIPLYANIISLNDPEVWYRYLQYLDGAMIENFAVGWQEGDESFAEWQMQLALAEGTQRVGKDVILVSQGEEYDHERQLFALASYLLVNHGSAYFRYIHHSSYDMHWGYDNYALALGEPLGERYQAEGVWVRDFSNGRVVVDPVAWRADVVLFEQKQTSE